MDHASKFTDVVLNRGEYQESASMDNTSSEGIGVRFRFAMRRHPAGVCLLTTGTGEAVNGMAVTAATSFSLDPPSILVCVNKDASLANSLSTGAVFGLTLLSSSQKYIAEAFSRKPSGRARFEFGDWRLNVTGPPQLDGAIANVACILEDTLHYGSHFAAVGRVTGVILGFDDDSLIYRNGSYWQP